MNQHRRRTGRAALLGAGLALVLVAGACSSDDDEDQAIETTTTTEPIVTAEVTATFDGPVTAAEAEQAATTMERRLTTYLELQGEPAEGSEVVVDEAGTGLVITVPGTDDTAEASALVTELSFRGDLYFRPGLVQYPPAPGQPLTPPDPTPEVDATDAGSSETTATTTDGATTSEVTTTTTAPTTTAPPATIPTPDAPDAADPNGTSVLEWRDVETPEQLSEPSSAAVLGIWEVGPSALSGSAVEDAQVTTLSGDPAVKVVLADEADGLAAFNSLTEACFSRTATCPSGAYTVTFDGTIVVASIPRPDDATFRPFGQDDVIIYSSEWSEDVAVTLAVAFEAGALPVPLSVTSS